jgi:ABC-type antimicrobial peptide transport system permease subunit
MSLKNLRLAWRVLAREPVYSAVAILGLAVALAACFLLFGLVRYAWTHNDAIRGADRIHVVKERRNLLPRPDWGESAPPPLANVALAAGLATDATSAKPFTLAARVGERVLRVNLAVAAPNYLRFFGVRALAGDADAALARPDALVLSRSEALRLFGTTDALGKVASIDGIPFVVRAILADMPANTSPEFGLLLGEGRHSWDKAPASEREAWSRRARLYLRTAADADTGALQQLLEQAVADKRDSVFSGAFAGRPKPYTSIALTSLSKVYFDPDLLSSRNSGRYGSPAAIAGLAGLGVLILVLAATNYVNLAAVRTSARRREIAVRKTLGISGAGLAGQFLAESLLVGAASTLTGALLAWLTLPLFSELVGRPLAASYGPGSWAILAAIGLGAGLLSGLYPAWLAARVPASVALGGRGGETAEGQRMRRLLTVAQFAAAIGLVAASLSVWWQASYASHADPGFDPRPQLVMELPGAPGSAAAHAFREELARLPGVAGVAAMEDAVGRDGNKAVILVRRPGAESVPLELKDVGANFFEVFGLRPLAGKLFTRRGEEGVVLNARAALALGFATPEAAVGQLIDDNRSRIIGIAPDLRYNSLREKPEAILYRLNEEQGVLTVRTRGDMGAARAAIEALWARHFPNDVPHIETASSVFARNYSEDMRQAKLLALASVVATALACFGIYVLSSYTIRRRAREFVLRKLHGARPRHIGLLVAREWLALLAAGAMLALGPAWLWTERYLAPFVERAPMGWWPLLIACAGVGAVALAGCGRQAVAAMRVSPAQALRD